MSQHQLTLLVTGASGQLGHRVVELLLEANVQPSAIIATTRSPEKLTDFAARGVVVRYADFAKPETLVEAFVGAERLLLISLDVLDGRLPKQLNAVKAAESAGVKHVLYTSLVDPDPSTPVTLAPDHWGTEQALRASSMGWTFLRNNIYADGLVQTLTQAVQLGGLYNAVGDGKIGYVTREDCACAAAAALADNFNGQRVLDISGPEAVTQAELAQIASEISGKSIPYVPLPVEVLKQNLAGVGLPQPIVDLIASFDEAGAQGKLEVVSNTVQALTGRKPMSVADFLATQNDTVLGREPAPAVS
jgi:NAD(P)H dehydrogenase (quinone)